ncbi:MAG: LCP family protein [Caldilineaceae bacterium]
MEAPIGAASNWQNTDNYLVLGTDRRQGAGDWRTDVVMVVGLDRSQGRAAVFSIPRDLYVNIPNYGMGRINQADFLGERNPGLYGSGPQLVSTIISQTLGIQTNHWVRFQMDGFVRVVDAIGGVNVYLDCPFAEPIFNLTTNSWDYFTLPAGDNWMDGDTAYWFVRLRLRSSDIERAKRQRQFLWALRDQMLNTNLITRFPELWGAFQDSFSTDLSLLELIELTRLGLSFDSTNVRSGGLTLADLQGFTTAQGAAVLGIADPGRVRAVVNGVWEAQPMADTNRRAPEQCAPLPQGVPQMNTAVTATYAPEGTVPITTTTEGQ